MARQSVLEYFRPDARPPEEIAVAWRRGYRTVRWSYGDVLRAASGFGRALQAHGIKRGDRVLIWGQNSGEWIAAFLACIFTGAVAVPMDAIADKAFAGRVALQAGVRVAAMQRGLPPLESVPATLWLDDLAPADTAGGVLPEFPLASKGRDDLVEIVFTSGTTSEPRGVALTHGNLLANLEPIEQEIERYRRYERIFHPLGFLDLLPLSHVFGQLLGIFLPQILGATSVFVDTLNPSEIARTIHDEHVSLLVAVPRLLESLRDQIERDLGARGLLEEFRRDFEFAQKEKFLRRWWRFRAIRRRFGWKFWAIVSGGAALPPELETFWTRLGYAVIQGYGLTETTSLISVNHPFRLGRGSIGKALPGLELKLAADGEILVRGPNVASGYLAAGSVEPVLGADGWFHTGDIGERDAGGNLYFKGRHKNVIVTPEGLNVYPEDLEAELRQQPEVRDCVVVGLEREGNAEPCAALLLRDSSASDSQLALEIVRRANERLAPFQQIRRWFVWPDADFPRTPTHKPALTKIREAAEARLAFQPGVRAGNSSSSSSSGSALEEILARVSRGRVHALDDSSPLQLSSIERVELLSALEDRYRMDLSETEFSRAETVGALQQLVGEPQSHPPGFHYPRWAQGWLARAVRAAVFHLLARPAMLLFGWPRVRGRDALQSVAGPVLVVANHITFFDPAYVLEALPPRLRGRLAVAMDGEFLESLRNPPKAKGLLRALAHRAAYALVVTIYNVFPLPLHAGYRKSFSFVGDLVDRGWSVLVFPEGARTQDGQMAPFRAGIGLLASRLRIPVVPVHLAGLFERKAAGKRFARPGQIEVAIGEPQTFSEGEAPEDIAQKLDSVVRSLGAPK